MVITKEESELIRKFIKEITGITYKENKDYFLELKLAPLIKKTNCTRLLDFYNLVKNLPFENPILRDFVDAITINETSFFRDKYPFDILKNRVFPKFRREKVKKIRILSVPSSTGQEPYSIVMMAFESFPELEKMDFKIISGDISEYALFRAREGNYKKVEIDRGITPYFLNKYFVKLGENSYKIKEELKKFVEFHKINVLEEDSRIWKKDFYDIVFFRNIMIYFDISTQKTLLQRIKEILKENGYLFIGSSEVVIGITRMFEMKKIEGGIVYINSKR